MTTLKAIQADITTLAVDAIVNAASWLQEVTFCCFSRKDLKIYEGLLAP